jgi:hypothetical protein
MSEPKKADGDTIFSSDDSLVVVFDGPGENIRRPRRPNNPPEWPPRKPTGETSPPSRDELPPPPDEDHR